MKRLKRKIFAFSFIMFYGFSLSLACPEGTTPDCGHLERDECGGHRFICGSGGNVNCCKPCGGGIQ